MASLESTTAHCVNDLLDVIHSNYEALRFRTEVLVRSGIRTENLPEESLLKAFSLLCDHDRKDLERKLKPNWQILVSKGLVKGSIKGTATPELRLLTHSLPHTDALESTWERIENASDVEDATLEVFRCSKRVSGLWGQPARLHFESYGIECALIIPDEVFALQSAMVTADVSGQLAGSFMFNLADGDITFKLLHKTGQIFQYIFSAQTKGVEI